MTSMRKPGIPNGSRTNQVFEFIKSEVDRCGQFPSVDAIRDHMGWKSRTAVRDTLIRLAGQRRLKRVDLPVVSAAKNPVHYEVIA